MANHRTIGDAVATNMITPLLGREYRLGGDGSVSGESFDCWGMLAEYCELRHRKNINCIRGVDGDYTYLYNDSRGAAMLLMNNFFADNFIRINTAYVSAGDILHVTDSNGDSTFGIYGGNGSFAVTSPETGCVVIHISHYNIEDCYRWPQ